MKQYDKAIEVYDRILVEYPNYKMKGYVQSARDKLKLMGGGR